MENCTIISDINTLCNHHTRENKQALKDDRVSESKSCRPDNAVLPNFEDCRLAKHQDGDADS